MCVCVRACVRACVCVCVCARARGCHVRGIQYYDCISIIFEVLMYTFFVELAKRSVLTLVAEIRRDINDRY